ncbi:hypothetical protein HZC09_03390 [Candidatus Micrarchaeota archaeon]|nr:hypothetical protein [Candidatus Micrarchaeota archaeon]
MSPFLFRWRESIAELFVRLYPKSVQRTMSVVGVEMRELDRFSKKFDDAFFTSVKNLLFNFVIALAVVYLAAVLNAEVLLPAFPNLPSSATLAVLILPLVVWPIYRTFQELRFLTTMVVEHFFGVTSVEKTSEALVGVVMVFMGVFAGSWLYGLHVPPLYLLVPLLYTILALLFLSRSLWSWFDRLEKVQGVLSDARSAPPELLKLAKTFDARGNSVSKLNEERVLAKEQIEEALAAGDSSRTRSLLSSFRKREAALLEKLQRSTAAHPFQERKRSKHLEGYFFGKLRKKTKTKKH